MVRIALGFLVVFGVVGTVETDPTFSLLLATSIGCFGLAIAIWGAGDLHTEQRNN